MNKAGEVQSPSISLGHEVDRAYRQDQDPAQYERDSTQKTPTGTVNEDKAIAASNAMARELNEPEQQDFEDVKSVVKDIPDPTMHTPQ